MTNRLNQLNPIDALYATAKKYPGGIEALAERMGKSASTIYKKLERSSDRHVLQFDEFVDIVALCAAAKVTDAHQALQALAWRFDHIAVPLPDRDSRTGAELAEQMVRVFKEGGEVAAAIQDAMADDTITQRECEQIDTEIMQTIAALTELRELVKLRAKNDGPTPLASVSKSA